MKHPERVNMVVFRENTEDIYAGIEWKACSREARQFYEFLHDEMGVEKVRFPETSAFGVKPVSAEGSKRLVKAACQYAVNQGSRHVTLVHKGNIMKFTEGGFKAWGYEICEDSFKDEVRMDDCICDAFLQNALLKPEAYDVIATLNLMVTTSLICLRHKLAALVYLLEQTLTMKLVEPFSRLHMAQLPTLLAPTKPIHVRSFFQL